MQARRLVILALLVSISVGWTQDEAEFVEPGWFNAAGVPGEVDLGAEQGVSAAGASVDESIAEAATPEIRALARGLENDPLRIFNYVHDQIRHVLYFGSKKGANLTLLERSGNDFDQCALLVALLREAGYPNAGYQFGILEMPYESADHFDLRRWLQISLPNTNWVATVDHFRRLLWVRGYPGNWWNLEDENTIRIHRVWVKLPIGGTNYLLDPAFKISERIPGFTNLMTAMGLDTNQLMNAAGGSGTADFVTNLTEVTLRSQLRNYTTNLLAWLKSDAPNASVEEVLGGWRILPATNTALSQSLVFSNYDQGGYLQVLDWENQPTSLMSKLTLTFAGTNFQCVLPELRGRRLSLTFSNDGVVRLWLEDSNAMQIATSGAGTINVTARINHPHGFWNTNNNAFVDTTLHDHTDQANPTKYQRTNATYVLQYAFESAPAWLRSRQTKLDEYRLRLGDDSREVVSETLNVMGLSWFNQTELTGRLLAEPANLLRQFHHRFGRMAQEQGKGYYLDAYLQLGGTYPSSGSTVDDQHRMHRVFDIDSYFYSALEHALIEQMQSSNLVAASTVKMLQLANTNAIKVFAASTANWTNGANVRSQLTNYSLAGLDSYINAGYTLLLPRDGLRPVSAGTGNWKGYGFVARYSIADSFGMGMMINGGYNGGFVSLPTAAVTPSWFSSWSASQPLTFKQQSASMPPLLVGDPVNIADGSFTVNETDLTAGQVEPRGFSLVRHYSPARRYHSLAGLAHGWTHNYYFNATEVSAPDPGLGETTPAQMASMLVATRAALELYRTNTDPRNWMATTLITKWGVDHLISNAVSITLGPDTLQFIKQPDGTFTPPAGSTMTLTKTNSAHTLQARHGNTFKFDTAGRLTNIVDQYNQTLKLTYNASNWVTTAIDWKNRTLTFNYTGTPSRLASVSSSSGGAVNYGYTTNAGRLDLTSVTDPENKTRIFVYDTNHQIIAVRNALEQTVTTNVYDDFGRVIEQYSQSDTNQLWRFYWSGSVNTEEDPVGARRRFTYDDKHRLIAQENALGNVSRTYYDGQDHKVMTVSPLNETNRSEFDGRHNLLRTIDPLNKTNQFVYDTQDHLTSTVDARGNTSYFGYNAKHQLTASTNAASDWTTLAYDGTYGTLTGRTDPGGTTSYAYDSFGLLNSHTYPGGLGSESFVNHPRGDVTNHTNARGFVTSFQYNQRRELTNTIAPTNVTAKVTYDAVGNVLTVTDPRGFTTSNTWSATRKLLLTTLPAKDNPTVTRVYDSRDWLIKEINPLSQITTNLYNAAGRVLAVTDPLLRTVKFGYDGDGRQIATTNAANEVTWQTWNARGELTKAVDAANRTVLRSNDAAGNLIALTNRNGKRWQFQYDAANRLTTTISPLNRTNVQTWNSRGLLASVKEPSGDTTTLTYDPKGRLTNRTDSVGATVYRYNANNNATNLVENGKTNAWTFDAYDRVSSFTNFDGYVIQYRYDANGNLTSLIYPGNRAVTYAYDSLNRLTNVTDWRAGNNQTAIEYDLASRVRKITRPNGTYREIHYDAAGQTTNILEKMANGVPIAFFKLNWNAAARMEWEFAAPLPHSTNVLTRLMEYDDDNRLKKFNGQWLTNDADGNLTFGPLTNDTFVTYTYDARNQLLNAGGLSYGYDPAGNRTALTNGTNVSRFVINPNAAISQVLMRARPGVTNYYVYGLGLHYEITETATSTNTSTYHYDFRGSTVALTDGNGIPTDRIEYSLYATTTYRFGTNDTPFLYNGRYGVQTDPNGVLHMRARYYNPHLCRFMNADPSGFRGGLNLYAYADGNPVSMMDPFGLGAVGASGSGSWLQEWQSQLSNGLRDMEWNDRQIHTTPIASGYEVLQGMGLLPSGANGGNEPQGSLLPLFILNVFAGRTASAAESETVRVGRWMSQAEADAMATSGRVQAPLNGTGASYVTVPPNPAAFTPPRSSSTFVEFNVPSSQLKIHDPGNGWGRVFGPGSIDARLAARQGQPVPTQMPPATQIQPTASAWSRKQ